MIHTRCLFAAMFSIGLYAMEMANGNEVEVWIKAAPVDIYRIEYFNGPTKVYGVPSREIGLWGDDRVTISSVNESSDGLVLNYWKSEAASKDSVNFLLKDSSWGAIAKPEEFKNLADIPAIMRNADRMYFCDGRVFFHVASPIDTLSLPFEKYGSVSAVSAWARDSKIAIFSRKSGTEEPSVLIYDLAKHSVIAECAIEGPRKIGDDYWVPQQIWWLDSKTLVFTAQFLRGKIVKMKIATIGDGRYTETAERQFGPGVLFTRNGKVNRIDPDGRTEEVYTLSQLGAVPNKKPDADGDGGD